ncbi:MAG: hypothetical protein M3P08_07700 [Thermoproteota archaeon]|nr:hypothetical protein [Thermoproteota archaeon]
MDTKNILETIKIWIAETGIFNLVQEDYPDTYFSFWITPKKEDNSNKRIFVTYPKQLNFPTADVSAGTTTNETNQALSLSKNDMIMVGWGWELPKTEQKAYSAIKYMTPKNNILGVMKHHCYSRGLRLSIEPDEVNLRVIKISRLLSLETINKSILLNTVLELKYMWALLMDQFEKNNMSRAGSDPLTP